MTSNPVNQPVEDQFLSWRQEMEAKQEKQVRQMAKLREHVNNLQKENEHLRTNKGIEPALPDHGDPLTDDELSSGSSPLPCHSPPQNNAEAESKKRPPRHSIWTISGTRRQMQREVSRDRPHSELALEHMPT